MRLRLRLRHPLLVLTFCLTSCVAPTMTHPVDPSDVAPTATVVTAETQAVPTQPEVILMEPWTTPAPCLAPFPHRYWKLQDGWEDRAW